MIEERATFRYAIGGIAILGGLLGLAGLFFIAIPDGNQEALLLALGIILGWGATVIGYEFGSSPSGRKAAEAGIAASQELAASTARVTEQAATAAIAATEAPQPVEVVNTTENPAIVAETPLAAPVEELPDYAR
jgi:hypothetical protein